MNINYNTIAQKVKNSLTGKLIIVGIILLVLLIPLFMTDGIRQARSMRAQSVEKEISSKWGGYQIVTAPVITMPVNKTIWRKNQTTEENKFCVLPEKLTVSGKMFPEIRQRGIYQALLYRSQTVLEGYFIIPQPVDNWNHTQGISQLNIGIQDIKGITALKVEIDGKEHKVIPSTYMQKTGVHCNLTDMQLAVNTKINFKIELELNGCKRLFFQPLGRDFSLQLQSTWHSPSFDGNVLPATREVTPKGFNAQWKVNELNREFPQCFIRNNFNINENSALGVNLVQVANPYQQVERVSDYAVLLISIILIAFLLAEYVTQIWMHPLQYFFAGLSLVVFYILLLALNEHISFPLSYCIAATIITAMTTTYSALIFEKKRGVPIIFGIIIALAYTLIYFLIKLEDYALLTGSGILLILLGILMKFTAHINRSESK